MKTLHANSLGFAAAIVAAAGMLIMGILGNLGMYQNAVAMMEQWHMFFSPSLGGIIGGMLEAAVISFVILYAFALVYNWLITKK
tara:strand:- start:5134 stop:5385 length:252 start_codon:yes stop_codon:yes gene_type:complete